MKVSYAFGGVIEGRWLDFWSFVTFENSLDHKDLLNSRYKGYFETDMINPQDSSTHNLDCAISLVNQFMDTCYPDWRLYVFVEISEESLSKSAPRIASDKYILWFLWKDEAIIQKVIPEIFPKEIKK